ncbi:YgiT-type zinc finger protein [candidate division KSB1 bacterium]|nr:YgiT-type zinc finger protein [candidate division KSB1 bacterium]
MAKPLEFETVDEEVEFWESHSTADYWDDMEKVEFEVDLHRNLLHPKLVFLADQPTKCPRCHHDLEETTIQYVTLRDGRLVMIRDVPALRCRVNGHEYMLENTLDQIEQVLNLEQTQKLRPVEMLHVPVFKLGMAA